MAQHMEAALNKAKANQGKNKKSKFGGRKGSGDQTVQAEDQTLAQVPETPVAPETTVQPPATAETKSETPATSDAPKAKKKLSPQVVRWKAQKNLPLDAKITGIQTPNPKRKSAAERFALYKEGMTVADYVKASKEVGNTGALAMADIRWDFAAGFIQVG